MESGKDINQILDMPFHFIIQILEDKNKPTQKDSLIAAFGGN